MGFFGRLFGKKQVENKVEIKVEIKNLELTLSEKEKQFCLNANLSEDDGLFLKKLTKHKIYELYFQNELSDTKKADAIFSCAKEESARTIVLENLDYFTKQGKYIFIHQFSNNGYNIALTASTSDPYKLMELCETNGCNYDIETEDIINKYKKWDNEFGIIPIAIGFDFCECKIINTNIDYYKLANEIYEFCPDVVDQGTETVEALEEEMKKSQTIFLWWD